MIHVTGKRTGSPPRRLALLAGLLVVACGGDPGAGDLDSSADIGGSELTAGGAGELPQEEHVVHLDSVAMAIAGIEVGPALTEQTTGFEVTGRITFDQNRVSHLGPRTAGYVVDILTDLGAEVGPGDLLAILESPEVGTRRADLTEAETVLVIARENHEREERLEAQGISSRKDLLASAAELRRAEAALLRATQRLEALGASEGEGAEFFIRAPFQGVVVERHAVRGEVVGPSDRLFTVAELDRLWIELDIYEADLHRVEEGQRVVVTTAAYPDRTFEGDVAYIADILEPERRTVRARVEVDNQGRALRPGMFATAEIEVPGSLPVVAVPREAVQTVEGVESVFIPGNVLGEFVVRSVIVGRELSGNRIEILSGLAAGERLVVRGAFTLKSELVEDEFGGHAH